MQTESITISPNSFDRAQTWYPQALNAQIHPMVAYFLNLTKDRIIQRYCHLNPQVNSDELENILSYRPRYFTHSGSDLFHVTNEKGNREMIVIETNSCPSGLKSMPLLDENREQGGYETYIKETFAMLCKSRRGKPQGGLAVVFDKNEMESLGYASAMADHFNEEVHLVPFYHFLENPPIRFEEGVMQIRKADHTWMPIRAAFRYVTQRPWNRLPIYSKTLIINPVIACLAGGRNKMMAAKAYDLYNAEILESGLKIRIPETIWDVNKNEIPLWVKKMGGHAVIKVPYSNAGQGVFTITGETELEAFMNLDFDYDMFIVQSLIGNFNWSSISSSGRRYHVGTMPDKKRQTFVADLRMLVHSTEQGLRPLSLYARRARKPLIDQLDNVEQSWDILGTNLSNKKTDGTFNSDSARLLMVDRKDFNRLGVSVDDLVEGYIQSVLATIAIDKMAIMLINRKGGLKSRLFQSLNDDKQLLEEILL